MGMACHLAALIGLLGIPFGNALGPLIFWLIKKDEIPFVDDQGKEALNFQITILIVVVAGMIIGFATCFYGFILTGPIMLAAGVLSVVFAILAAMQANKGVAYRYPLTIRFIK